MRELPTQIGVSEEDHIPGLQELTATIQEGGAKAIAHLNHPGRMANPKIPGNTFYSSTDKACENGGATPRAMSEDDMAATEKLFADAAQRSVKAGFDIIELQMGHGYLLAQFLSPAVNDRQDKYGGNRENRKRFPMRIFHAVKASVDIPVIVRISRDEMIENGLHVPDMKQFSKELQDAGADAIHVSAGSACSPPPWFFQHMFTPKGKTWEWAAQIKEELDIPVIFVGRVNSPNDVGKLEKEYKVDYIGLGRALIADPDFSGKYLGEVKGQIRPCLACSEGCLGGVKGGKGLHCVVNLYVGEIYKPEKKPDIKKSVAIVGGGLAGMQSAITLQERGHRVVIFEKDRLGGQFNLAHLPPNKGSLKEIIDYFVHEIKTRNIEVQYQKVSKQELTDQGYDQVILATGAVPAVPPIKSLKEFFWTEFLHDENLPSNQKILVIGGGLIGIEMASKLIDKNNNVIVVEMLEEVACGMERIEKTMPLNKLSAHNTPLYSGHKVVEVRDDVVIIENENEQKQIEGIEKIIVATGMQSYRPLAEELNDDINYKIVGDASRVGKAQDAIRSAFTTCRNL